MAARSNARVGALSVAIILCVTTLCAADSVNAQISGKAVRIGVLGDQSGVVVDVGGSQKGLLSSMPKRDGVTERT